MKKLLTATIAVCMLASLLCLSACNISIYNYDNADSYTAGGGEFDLNDVVALDINWVSDKLVVKTDSATNNITIDEENNKTEAKYQMQHYLDANKTLHIRFVEDGTSLVSIGIRKVLTVTLPADDTIRYDDIDIATVSADIEANGFGATDINIDTVSGDANFANVDTIDLAINTVSGNIRYNGILSGNVDVNSVSGDVTLSNVMVANIDIKSVSGRCHFSGAVSGSINANTVSGNYDIRTSTMPTGIQCDSASGDIVLLIPDNDGFRCSFRTASGQFDSNFAVTTSGNIRTYGNGSVVIDIKTISGNFRIDRNQ